MIGVGFALAVAAGDAVYSGAKAAVFAVRFVAVDILQAGDVEVSANLGEDFVTGCF